MAPPDYHRRKFILLLILILTAIVSLASAFILCGEIETSLRYQALLTAFCVLAMAVSTFLLMRINRQERETLLLTHRTENELRLYQKAVENSKDLISIIDPQLRFQAVNRAFLDYFGVCREEVIGRAIAEFTEPEFYNAVHEEALRECLAGAPARRESLRDYPAAGLRHMSFSYSPLRAADGTVEGIVLTSHDLTAQKDLALVTEAHQRLAAAVEQASEGIIITDTAGNIQYVNSAYERLTGYSGEETRGRNVATLHANRRDQDAPFEEMWQALHAGESWSGRMTSRKKDGTSFEEEATWSPVRDAAGKIVHFVSIRRDISVERSLEEQLRQSQKMEAVGRLAGGVAHDFNNLLTAITGYAEMLRLKIAPNHPAQHDIGEILKAAERSSALTRQLLAFSRKQVLQPGILELNTIVQDMEKMLRRIIGEDIELASHLAPDLGRIRADRNQIEQVLANLAVNARDAMAGGGKLTIETANIEIDNQYLQQHLEVDAGAYVLLTVSDTGCGMSAQTQNHIFEPFFTTKESDKGTGLGLSTVYGIVKQSGGFISVYSEVGYGTTFKIYLPRICKMEAGAHIESAEGSSAPAMADGRKAHETVLLVEDEETVRELISRYLSSEGYQVLDAPSPVMAQELSARHEGPIDLMITDVIMPQMNGRELVRQLAPLRPGMKILFISGYTENAIIDQGNLDPGAAFLQKPFTVGALSQKLKEIMDEAGTRA